MLSTGGDLHLTGQVYSPPYLFEGARPTISFGARHGRLWRQLLCGHARRRRHHECALDPLGHRDARPGLGSIHVGRDIHADGRRPDRFGAASPRCFPAGLLLFVDYQGGCPSVSKIIRIGDPPTVSVTGTTVTEGATGVTTNAQFTVSLSESSAQNDHGQLRHGQRHRHRRAGLHRQNGHVDLRARRDHANYFGADHRRRRRRSERNVHGQLVGACECRPRASRLGRG